MDQPDSVIPNLFDPQSLNRYSYVQNNPVRNTDPTGHGVDRGDPYYNAEMRSVWAAASSPARTQDDQVPSGRNSGESSRDERGGGGGGGGGQEYVKPYVSDPKELARRLVGESTSDGKDELPAPENLAQHAGSIGELGSSGLSLELPCLKCWLDSTYYIKGVVYGVGAGLDVPNPIAPVAASSTVGVDYIMSEGGFGTATFTDGLFGYAGGGAAVGAGGNIDFHLGLVLNPGEHALAAGDVRLYQASVSVGVIGIKITDAVPIDSPPFAPRVPQIVTVGWAPGARVSVANHLVYTAPLSCGGPLCR